METKNTIKFPRVVGCWFTEGLAEAIGDGGVFQKIRCWPEVAAFRNRPDSVNPLTIRVIEEMPGWDGDFTETASVYYPMFGLAVGYLVDPRGLGRTYVDVKNMFRDIGAGMDFGAAFEIHMGISLENYRENFYTLMQAYLPAACPE